ncbi:MAG TPA: GtrA family protein [Candidatus Competibacteraceae bacterium]|nr:GtrA family protein [Candidatus Competibacteraceae bacterium]
MHRKISLNFPDFFRNNELIKFCIVGSFCALQNILILYYLTSILNFHYIFSIFLQMLYVNTLGFYLNRRYTFSVQSSQFWQELFKYHTVMVSSFFTVSILMYLLVEVMHIWYLSAFILLTIGMTIYNFLAHKRWTFKKIIDDKEH